MGATPHKAVTNLFPQVGGNRTSEAPGVVFDPTTGGKGMETPPPNDSLKASLSPPVGGRLCSIRRDWQTNKCSSNVANAVYRHCRGQSWYPTAGGWLYESGNQSIIFTCLLTNTPHC